MYKETTYTFFYDTLKPKLRKNIFRNLKVLKITISKKMTPKSQAKIKPPLAQYPFLTIFNLKKGAIEIDIRFKVLISL